MPKTKKPRRTTPHPGVKITRRKLPSGRREWVARWREPHPDRPGSMRVAQVSFAKLNITNEDARVAWAKRKAEKLRQAEAQRRIGSRRDEGPWMIADAIEEYVGRCRGTLREKTVEGYERSLGHFGRWAVEARVKTLLDLDEPALGKLRDWLMVRPRKTAAKKKGRGKFRETATAVSPLTVHHDLLRIRIFLRDARRLGRLPQIDRETISEALKGKRPPKRRPRFLRPAECQELLRACLRHDSEVFELTREEKAAGLPGGGTRRYHAVSPIVLFLLLSGCRLREALELEWSHCYLDGEEPELVLPAALTKTATERSVDLAVSPWAAKLLGALKLKREGKYVFGGTEPASRSWLAATRKRLKRDFGAPIWSPQALRATCASVLCCAGAIYGAASIFLESKRLGHSVAIAESRYAGTLRDLPRDARTIEQALGIGDLARQVVEFVGVVQAPARRAE